MTHFSGTRIWTGKSRCVFCPSVIAFRCAICRFKLVKAMKFTRDDLQMCWPRVSTFVKTLHSIKSNLCGHQQLSKKMPVRTRYLRNTCSLIPQIYGKLVVRSGLKVTRKGENFPDDKDRAALFGAQNVIGSHEFKSCRDAEMKCFGYGRINSLLKRTRQASH